MTQESELGATEEIREYASVLPERGLVHELTHYSNDVPDYDGATVADANLAQPADNPNKQYSNELASVQAEKPEGSLKVAESSAHILNGRGRKGSQKKHCCLQ